MAQAKKKGRLFRLSGHAAIYAFAPQVSRICNIFALPVVTPFLTEYDYGVYGVYLAYVLIFDTCRDLGLTVLASNAFFKRPAIWKTFWRRYHSYLILWAPWLSCLKILLLWFFVFRGEEAANWFPLIVLFSLIQDSIYLGANFLGPLYFRFSEKPAYLGMATGIAGMVGVATNVCLIAGLNLGFIGWIAATFAARTITFVAFLKPVYFDLRLWPNFVFSKARFCSDMAISLPLVPHKVSSFLLNSSDRMVMKHLKVPMDSIGGYSVAYQVGQTFQIAAVAIGKVYAPILQKTYAAHQNDEHKGHFHVRNLLFLVQTCFLLGSFLICLWMRELFPILIRNPDLSKWYPVCIVIVMAYNYRPIYSGAVSLLFFTEQTKSLWKITLIGGIINVVLNLIFVPIYGVLAATVTTFLALMFVGFSGFWLPEFRRESKTHFYPIEWLLLTTVTTLFVFMAVEMVIPAKAALSLLALLTGGIISVFLWRRVSQNPSL